MVMVLGVLIGMVIWLLFELNVAMAKPDYELLLFFKKNIFSIVINLACALTIVWMKDDIKEYFELTRFSAVMLGMSGQAVMKKLSNIFNSNTQTFVGVNKDTTDK